MPDVELHRRGLSCGDKRWNANEIRQLAVGNLDEKIPPNFFNFSKTILLRETVKGIEPGRLVPLIPVA